MRTPLTFIGGYLELLQDGDAGEVLPEQAQMLEIIERNTIRLGGLIEDIPVLNRIEAGQLKFNTERVSIGELMAHTVEELRPLAHSAGVVVDLDLCPESYAEVGDRGHLQRTIVNIFPMRSSFRPAAGGEFVVFPRRRNGEDRMQ